MRTNNKTREREQIRSYPFGNQSFISKRKKQRLATPKQLHAVKLRYQDMQTTTAHSAVTLQCSKQMFSFNPTSSPSITMSDRKNGKQNVLQNKNPFSMDQSMKRSNQVGSFKKTKKHFGGVRPLEHGQNLCYLGLTIRFEIKLQVQNRDFQKREGSVSPLKNPQ